MKVLVPVKRVVDANVRVRVKADGSGEDTANVKFSMNPFDEIGVEDLTIAPLIKRIKQGAFREIIMGTNPTIEGDGTALCITNLLEGFPIRLTRLARGITTGSYLEFANKEMLADALSGRQDFQG